MRRFGSFVVVVVLIALPLMFLSCDKEPTTTEPSAAASSTTSSLHGPIGQDRGLVGLCNGVVQPARIKIWTRWRPLRCRGRAGRYKPIAGAVRSGDQPR